MNRVFTLLLATLVSFQIQAQIVKNDSVVLGTSYANMVYYSLANGTVSTVPKDGWDIEFVINAFSASIRINDGVNVELYKPVNDSLSHWPTADTANMVRLYNLNDTTWDDGAFSDLATGHPDYGWGYYIGNGNITGKRFFIIRLRDGNWKKIAIENLAAGITYTVKYADLDGSNEVTFNFAKSGYAGKVSVPYDLVNNQVVNNAPPAADWDLVFRQYQKLVPPGEYYRVTGVFANPDLYIAERRDVPVASNDYNGIPFLRHKDVIGHDWKEFDLPNFQWVVFDSITYFTTDADTNVYKIVFTGFDGQSTGIIRFDIANMNSVGIPEREQLDLNVFPNPVSQSAITLQFDSEHKPETIRLFNTQGQQVAHHEIKSDASNRFQLNVEGLPNGMYLLEAQSDRSIGTHSVLILR